MSFNRYLPHPALRASPQRFLSEEICGPPSKLGAFYRPAPASRPDIRARLADSAAEVDSLEVCDVYQINDLIKTTKAWQQPAALKKKVWGSPETFPIGLAV